MVAMFGENNSLAVDVFSAPEPLEADESVRTDVGPVSSDRLIIVHFAEMVLPSCSAP